MLETETWGKKECVIWFVVLTFFATGMGWCLGIDIAHHDLPSALISFALLVWCLLGLLAVWAKAQPEE
jgi:hypothetical protein